MLLDKNLAEPLALLDERPTANVSSETENESPSRCYDVNDNSANVCLLGRTGFVSTRRVQPGLRRDLESRIHFHKSFLDTTSRLCGWQSVNCLCIDNAKELRWDLSSSAAIYGCKIRMTFSLTVIMAPLIQTDPRKRNISSYTGNLNHFM